MESRAVIFIHDREDKLWLYEPKNGCPSGVGEQIMNYVMNVRYSEEPTAKKVYEDLLNTYQPLEDYKIPCEWRYDLWVGADSIVYACEDTEDGEQFRIYKKI